MFALTFFGILHVPINVPALGFSTGQDNVDVDRELVAHGISNALSGCAGSIQVCCYHHSCEQVNLPWLTRKVELFGIHQQLSIYS